MEKEILATHYGISAEQGSKSGNRTLFQRGKDTFLLIKTEKPIDEIKEQTGMAYHLHAKGEQGIWLPIQNQNQNVYTETEQGMYVLCMGGSPPKPSLDNGRDLAIFHYRGRSIPQRMEHTTRMGKWKELWEKRSNQLDQVWRDKLMANPQNEFEELFIDSFPYYSGLVENAIQYLVDTEIDEQPEMVDGGTVCYERFTDQTWKDGIRGKIPEDWVFDHGARDIAEWVRNQFLKQPNLYYKTVETFFRHYQTVTPLSTFSLRLIYSRLLLPVHYFETIETYYVARNESQKGNLEENLSSILKQSGLYERMLYDLYEIAGVPQGNNRIPIPEWIKNQVPHG